MAQAEAMPEQAMAASVVAVDVANKDRLALMPTQATEVSVVAAVARSAQTSKARAAPLLWLSSGEELR